MRKWYSVLLILQSLAVMFFGGIAGAEQVKCNQCVQETPCVTVLEFKNVKFAHDVYCWVDKDGEEHWDSDDQSKLELFYYFDGEQDGGSQGNQLEM